MRAGQQKSCEIIYVFVFGNVYYNALYDAASPACIMRHWEYLRSVPIFCLPERAVLQARQRALVPPKSYLPGHSVEGQAPAQKVLLVHMVCS